MQATSRLDQLERLAAAVEQEIRRERAKRRQADHDRPRRVGRPPSRSPDDHGTEKDYQAHRSNGEKPCDLCKAGHALAERRRYRERRKAGNSPRSDRRQLTIYDALKEA